MPGLRRQAVVFGAILTVVFMAAIIVAAGYGFRARMAPMVIAIPGFILSAGLMAVEIRLALLEKKKNAADHLPASKVAGPGEAEAREAGVTGSGKGAAAAEPAGAGGEAHSYSELNALLWVVLLLALLFVLGFMVTIPLYLFLYMKVRSQEPWLTSAMVSLASWAILYFLFVRVLSMNFYAGIILETLF